MTHRRIRIKRHAKAAEPVIRPTGGDLGLYRVRYADGSMSEAVGMTEAREIVRMVEMRTKRR